MSGLLKAVATGLLLSLLLLSVRVSATVSAQGAQPQVAAPVQLHVVQDHRWAPFAFRDQQGNAQGLIIDIWRLIAAKQQLPLQVELMDWPDTITRVQNSAERIHGGLLLSPERRKTLAFSAPLFELRTAIFTHTKKLAGAIDIGDLQTTALGVVAGGYEEEYLRSHYETQPLRLYQNNELLVQAAIAGEVDAFVADYPVGMYYLDRYTTPDKFSVLSVLYRRSIHAAVARDNTALLALINTAIGAITAEEMTALQQKWVNHKEVRVFNWSALLLVALALIALTAVGLLLQTRSLNRKLGRQRAQLREHEQQMALLTDNMTDWVWKIDAGNRYSYLSPSVSKLLGYQPQELLGQPMEMVLHASERERALAEFQHVMRNAKRYGTTGVRDSVARYGLQHKNGELVWTEAAVRMFFNGEGEFMGAQGSSRDIRERKEAEDIIRQSVSTDALTRLPNRRQLNEQLQKAMAACGRHHQYAALVFVDIDNFRYVNDNYGHDQGDLLLQEIAQRLLSNLRPGDSLARFDGDEFVLVVEQLGQDYRSAERLAQEFGEQLLALFARDFVLINQRCKVSTSIGIALFNGDERSASTLLKFADSAMNQAKVAGRNCCVIHSTHTKG